jgi:hypothetical protein
MEMLILKLFKRLKKWLEINIGLLLLQLMVQIENHAIARKLNVKRNIVNVIIWV